MPGSADRRAHSPSDRPDQPSGLVVRTRRRADQPIVPAGNRSRTSQSWSWRVGPRSTTIDGVGLSSVRPEDLGLRHGEPIRICIGVLPDAENVGGINLFGREFGNYPQDIELRIEYEHRNNGDHTPD